MEQLWLTGRSVWEMEQQGSKLVGLLGRWSSRGINW